MARTPRDIAKTARAIALDIAYHAAHAEVKEGILEDYQPWMARSIAKALLAERNRKSLTKG